MDLRTFIAETLVQIADGINDANAKLTKVGAVANPANVEPSTQQDANIYGVIVPPKDNVLYRVVQAVNIDVAVVAADDRSTKGGIGIVVGAVALGTQGAAAVNNSSQSRVQFSVPMALPVGKI
jgi:hypothetical protein